MAKSGNTILIVDDTPENLRVLGELLEADGHEVRVATDGVQGRDIAHSSPVDLILLDVMMPGDDGYEVCRQLKASPNTAHIPIVFLTALDSTEDEAKGLTLGAVDYITKPFQLELVRARVSNHLALHNARRELRRHNEELEVIVAERTKELAEAHARLLSVDSAKYDFLQVIYQQLWAADTGLLDLTHQALVRLDPEWPDAPLLMRRYEDGQAQLFDTLNHALLLSGSHLGDASPKPRPVRLEVVLRNAVEKLSPAARSRDVTLTAVEGEALASGDLDLVFQSLTTIVHAALLAADPGTAVTATLLDAEPVSVEIAFQTASKEKWEDLFDPNLRFHPSPLGRTLGLALPLAAKIARAQNGSITARSKGRTHRFALSLPRFERPAKGVTISL